MGPYRKSRLILINAAILGLVLFAGAALAQSHEVLHSFTASDGAIPHADLIRAADDNFRASGEIPGAGETRAKERLSGARVPFIANSGQTDPAVAYYAPTFAGTVFVTRDGRIVYSLPGEKASASGEQFPDKSARRGGWSLTETFIGGRARPSGSDPATTRVSYFLGNDPARWRSVLPTFEGVSLGQVWPGISLDLRAHGKNVEKLFTVEPGGDPSRIRMSVAGARRLRVNEAGALVVATGLGEVTFTPPAASQERDGVRHPVLAAYELRGREYGFRLGDYDPALPVVIDPLLQSTYLGGSGADEALALAIHPTTGEVYVAGFTDSTDFPGTAGGAQPAFRGTRDAFVARLNAALTTLIQATYLGGGGDDRAFALAIHPTSGEVYVAGFTASLNFPGTAGGAQPAISANGTNNAFVARLDATLTTLHQATYLGGGNDEALALAIHPTSGEVYVAGFTESANFPGTAGGAQPAHATGAAGAVDAFVARLNAGLTSLQQATYLGGNGTDEAFAVAIHPSTGEVYVAGTTSSSNLPGTAGGAQPAKAGNFDAFVTRLNAALTTFNQATYLGGGEGEDTAYALAIHPTSGEVYAAGFTSSNDFPGTAGGAQQALGAQSDAFVARLNAALTTLNQATYLGGANGNEYAFALAIHPTSGEVYVAGVTDSNDFPGTAGGAQPVFRGPGDAFLARLNAALTTLNQATYLGGSGSDEANALAIHPTSGEVYVAGFTKSTSFPHTDGGAQPANGGGVTDAFVARLTADLLLLPKSIVYTPLSPCRIMDTRNATVGSGVQGPIAGGSLKLLPGFITAGSNWGQYGQTGTLSDCGLTNPPGTFIHGVAIVITILNPNFDAFLGVSDVNSLSTTLSTVALNYTHGQGLSTMYIVPQIASNTVYFAMPTGLSANLIFDVVGYFVASDATALACTTATSGPVVIGAASTGSAVSPACSAGYALSSGSCDSDSTSMELTSDKASGGNTTWTCTANNTGASAHLTATANCCRVPGK